MKKITFLLLLILVITFSGCAMDESYEPEEVDCEYEPDHPECSQEPLEDVIRFDGRNFEFVDIEPQDIFKDIVSINDIIFIYVDVYKYTLTDQEIASLQVLLPKINVLLENDYHINTIVRYNLSEFKDVMDLNLLSPTTEDMFTFNLFKEVKSEIPSRTMHLSKIEYLEYYINRSLTENEIEGLELLQTHIQTINQTTTLFDLASGTFEELQVFIEIDTVLTEIEYNQIEAALTIIQSLLN